jgi:GNAT superfamily N-acetyltransferase
MKPSTLHVSIERAKRKDGPSILQLLSAAQLPVDGLIDHLHSAVIARADGGVVVGRAALEIYADGALLRSVVVDDGVHGQGIGTRLTTAALDPGERPWHTCRLPANHHGRSVLPEVRVRADSTVGSPG